MTTEDSNAVQATATAALQAALARAIVAANAVEKDARNSFHKYKYASAEAVLAEARAVLGAEGLAVVPLTEALEKVGDEQDWALWLNRSLLLTHADGGFLALSQLWPIVPEKGRPLDKALAGAKTTGLAYLLRDLLLLPRVEEGVEMDHGRRDDRPQRARKPAQKREMQPAPVEPLAVAAFYEKAAELLKHESTGPVTLFFQAVAEKTNALPPAELDDAGRWKSLTWLGSPAGRKNFDAWATAEKARTEAALF